MPSHLEQSITVDHKRKYDSPYAFQDPTIYNETRESTAGAFMGWPYSIGNMYSSMEPFSSTILSIQGSDECLSQPDNYGGGHVTSSPVMSKFARIEEEITENPRKVSSVCEGKSCRHGPRFMLREQPKPKQRKSYRNENRYLLPNPTSVILTEEAKDRMGPSIAASSCTVTLLDGNGNRLPRQVSHYIENTDGNLKIHMEPPATSFEYTLKVRQNSGPDKFMLCFHVQYDLTDGTSHQETILSTPFLVQSNKSFFSKDPKLTSIQPPMGLNDRPNEVWIKGRDFNEKGVSVRVDGVDATVIEVQPNLIVILTPARQDIHSDRRVTVNVCNMFKHKKVHSEQELDYIYVTAKDGTVSTKS